MADAELALFPSWLPTKGKHSICRNIIVTSKGTKGAKNQGCGETLVPFAVF